MSRAVFSYGPTSLGTFVSSGTGDWITLPHPCHIFGLVLDVSSSTVGGTLQGSIGTTTTEVVTLALSTGPHVFSTGGTPVSRVRYKSTGVSTATQAPLFTASL